MGNLDTLGILKQLERGEINSAEADARLNTPALKMAEPDTEPPFQRVAIPAWMKLLWMYALVLGVLTVLLGTWIVAATVHSSILWLFVGLPVILLGALILAISASVFSGHWLYVDVKESRRRGHSIRFAIPFPLDLVRLGLWVAQFFIPKSRSRRKDRAWQDKFAGWQDPEELFTALERELKEGRGITVDVDEKGERVQVFIV